MLQTFERDGGIRNKMKLFKLESTQPRRKHYMNKKIFSTYQLRCINMNTWVFLYVEYKKMIQTMDKNWKTQPKYHLIIYIMYSLKVPRMKKSKISKVLFDAWFMYINSLKIVFWRKKPTTLSQALLKKQKNLSFE